MPTSQTQTLVAATVATYTFAAYGGSEIIVEVDAGAGPVFVSIDGSTPTVNGPNEYEVSTTGERLLIPTNPPEPGLSVPLPSLAVKCVATGTPTVTVTVD